MQYQLAIARACTAFDLLPAAHRQTQYWQIQHLYCMLCMLSMCRACRLPHRNMLNILAMDGRQSRGWRPCVWGGVKAACARPALWDDYSTDSNHCRRSSGSTGPHAAGSARQALDSFLGMTHVGGADRASLAAAAGFLGAASGSASGIRIWTRFLAAGAKRIAPSCMPGVLACFHGPSCTAWELVRQAVEGSGADSPVRRLLLASQTGNQEGRWHAPWLFGACNNAGSAWGSRLRTAVWGEKKVMQHVQWPDQEGAPA